MVFWPFKRSAGESGAAGLLEAVIAASRQPALYGEGRVPDTLEGRFELMTLHGALALMRLRAEPGTKALAQRFTDKLFRHFDSGLREAAVGDLTVPKKMRRLAGDFYGRLEVYSAALTSGDNSALRDALARNLLGATADADSAGMADYAAALSARLAGIPVESLGDAQNWRLQSA